MDVRFIYRCDNRDSKREVVIIRTCKCMADLIELPRSVEVEFMNMEMAVYAQTVLDPRFPNRITLNNMLASSEVLKPLIHELIHLNQIHTGQLRVYRDGTHLWQNRQYRVADPLKMPLKDYNKLPWEQDVANKQHRLLEQVLARAEQLYRRTL